MTKRYENILKNFYCESPDMQGEVPIKHPETGEEFKVNITTKDVFALETMEAGNLLGEFEKNYELHTDDFIMSGIVNETRFIWHCCKSENDSGIVTFHMPKKYKRVAEAIMHDLAQRIKAKSIRHIPREYGEA
jgi:hypothetical protein